MTNTRFWKSSAKSKDVTQTIQQTNELGDIFIAWGKMSV